MFQKISFKSTFLKKLQKIWRKLRREEKKSSVENKISSLLFAKKGLVTKSFLSSLGQQHMESNNKKLWLQKQYIKKICGYRTGNK